jgi:hypothetical protein
MLIQTAQPYALAKIDNPQNIASTHHHRIQTPAAGQPDTSAREDEAAA